MRLYKRNEGFNAPNCTRTQYRMSSRPFFPFEILIVNRSRHPAHLTTEVQGGWMEEQTVEATDDSGVLVVARTKTDLSYVQRLGTWLWPHSVSTTALVPPGASLSVRCRTTHPVLLHCRLRSCEPATVFQLHQTAAGCEKTVYKCRFETPPIASRLAWRGKRSALQLLCDSHPDAVE